MNPALGVIADDLTGATDLASTLVNDGLRVVLSVGTPSALVADADAVVVALKTRSIEPARAVEQSLAAARRLHAAGVRQLFFKYCSTFDSTPRGNIGPVLEALVGLCDVRGGVACPAFPDAGRTVYQGHLFVGSQLLHETGMRHHPLNPMTDANLVRVLQQQTAKRVSLIPLAAVRGGLRAALADLDSLAIVDAVTNADLRAIGEAVADLPVISGGSGLGLGLPAAYRRRHLVPSEPQVPKRPRAHGHAAVLAGSCSEATLAQVRHASRRMPRWHIEPHHSTDEVLHWAEAHLPRGPVLIDSSVAAEELRQLADPAEAAVRTESRTAELAAGLVERGVRRLVVAGGETAGAVVARLGVTALRVGPAICPGVPWTESIAGPPLALALKSGNFGGPAFFTDALGMLT